MHFIRGFGTQLETQPVFPVTVIAVIVIIISLNWAFIPRPLLTAVAGVGTA